MHLAAALAAAAAAWVAGLGGLPLAGQLGLVAMHHLLHPPATMSAS